MELRAKGNKKPVRWFFEIYSFHPVALLSQNTGLTVFTPPIILGILVHEAQRPKRYAPGVPNGKELGRWAVCSVSGIQRFQSQ
jgi:hypothetical protein